MHKLDRSVIPAPACLGNYNYKTQNWEDLGGTCKGQLRAALVQMQGIPGVTTPDADEYGLRCAYCEGPIYHAGHIEHFRRKNPAHYPELTFAWDNLFLACGSNIHCGHFKDKKRNKDKDENKDKSKSNNPVPDYNPDELIKPDIHDPLDYLFFHSSGEVRIRRGLTCEDDIRRAKETIRVFGLDNRTLAGSRFKALSVYKEKVMADLEEVATWPPGDRQAYLDEEIAATRYDPYATTIQHFLENAV